LLGFVLLELMSRLCFRPPTCRPKPPRFSRGVPQSGNRRIRPGLARFVGMQWAAGPRGLAARRHGRDLGGLVRQRFPDLERCTWRSCWCGGMAPRVAKSSALRLRSSRRVVSRRRGQGSIKYACNSRSDAHYYARSMLRRRRIRQPGAHRAGNANAAFTDVKMARPKHDSVPRPPSFAPRLHRSRRVDAEAFRCPLR
jgi:hypothetical protein